MNAPGRLRLLAVALCVTGLVLLIWSAVSDSLIIDEIEHIAAGFYAIQTGSLFFNSAQPPLVKFVAAVPLLVLHLNPATDYYYDLSSAPMACYGFNLFYNCGNDPQLILFVSRLSVISFNCLLLALNIFYIRKLFGARMAFFFAGILMSSPTFFAHFKYVAMDVPVSLAMLLTFLGVATFKNHPTLKAFLEAVVIFGSALLTKFSALIVIPSLFLSLVIRSRKGLTASLKQILSCAAICLLIVAVLNWFDLLRGIFFQLDRLRTGGIEFAYFAGEIYHGRRILFFPTLFLLKEQLCWLLIVFLGVGAEIFQPLFESEDRSTRALLVSALSLFIFLYGAVSVFAGLNLGIRHIFPIYPALAFVASSGLLRIYCVSVKLHFLVLCTLCACFLNLLAIAPSYLSFFNTLGGGVDGYVWGVDSNFDWGQDATKAVDWIRQHPSNHIFIDFFGRANPYHYLDNRLSSWSASGGPLRRGDTLIISITRLQQARARRAFSGYGLNYEWLEQYRPTERIGTSLFVYQISDSIERTPK